MNLPLLRKSSHDLPVNTLPTLCPESRLDLPSVICFALAPIAMAKHLAGTGGDLTYHSPFTARGTGSWRDMLTCSQQPLGGCQNWNLNCHDFRPVCSVPFEALILPTVSDVWDLFSPIKALCSLQKSELDTPSKWEEK